MEHVVVGSGLRDRPWALEEVTIYTSSKPVVRPVPQKGEEKAQELTAPGSPALEILQAPALKRHSSPSLKGNLAKRKRHLSCALSYPDCDTEVSLEPSCPSFEFIFF